MGVSDDPLLTSLEKTTEGVSVGECVLVEKLGAGGMGAVYRGRHLALDIDVAVKVLPFHAAADPKAVERFRREAQAAARIDHPNLVRVYNVGEERGVHYIVMEYVQGEAADSRLKRLGRFSEREALRVAMAAGEALSAAHAKGILHRDVKPANVLIRAEDGRVKLADLGLAKVPRGGDASSLTASGQVMGTPAFMSPEQATDASRVDARTDIYSLGATLYALLSGKPPFQATELLPLLMMVTREEPRDLAHIRPDVSAATLAVLRKLMAKEREARPATMNHAVAELRRSLSGGATAELTLDDVSLAAPRARKGRAWKALAVAGALVLAAGAFLAGRVGKPRRSADVPAGAEERPPGAVEGKGSLPSEALPEEPPGDVGSAADVERAPAAAPSGPELLAVEAEPKPPPPAEMAEEPAAPTGALAPLATEEPPRASRVPLAKPLPAPVPTERPSEVSARVSAPGGTAARVIEALTHPDGAAVTGKADAPAEPTATPASPEEKAAPAGSEGEQVATPDAEESPAPEPGVIKVRYRPRRALGQLALLAGARRMMRKKLAELLRAQGLPARPADVEIVFRRGEILDSLMEEGEIMLKMRFPLEEGGGE